MYVALSFNFIYIHILYFPYLLKEIIGKRWQFGIFQLCKTFHIWSELLKWNPFGMTWCALCLFSNYGNVFVAFTHPITDFQQDFCWHHGSWMTEKWPQGTWCKSTHSSPLNCHIFPRMTKPYPKTLILVYISILFYIKKWTFEKLWCYATSTWSL